MSEPAQEVLIDKPPSYDEAVQGDQYDQPFKGNIGQTNQGSSQSGLNTGGYTSYGSTFSPQTQVILVGGCPACRIGVLEDEFSVLGILCAIVFFPLGILCCLALRQRRCSNCGAMFG